MSIYIALGNGLELLIGGITNQIEFSINSPLWVFLVIGGVLLFSGILCVWLAGRFLDRRLFTEFGFHLNREWWVDFSFGLGLGILLISLIFITELAFGWVNINEIFFVLVPKQLFPLPFLIFLFLFLCIGISEELVSRGYLLKNLGEGFNINFIGPRGAIIIAWILSSIVFGLFHIDNNNATFLSTLNITVGGVFLGLGYVMTRELAIPIGLHISWNLFQANVFGFPVSGITIPSEVVTVFTITPNGPEIWTGGAFGPEGGLLCSIAFLLGIFITLIWLHHRRRLEKEMIDKTLAYYTNPKLKSNNLEQM
jgi:membrane protease YdiL (CAAX protease family)